MTKTETTYSIKLELYSSYVGDEWKWALHLGAEKLASGFSEYRWLALRAAKKAARRHSRGLPPIKPAKTLEGFFYYTVARKSRD